MQAIERQVESLDWVSLIFLAIFLILSVAKTAYPQRFSDFITLLISNKFMVFRGKEYKAFHPFNILLFMVHVLIMALLGYLILALLIPEITGTKPWILFIRIATAYASFFLLKFGIEKIIGNIFSLDQKIEYYLYQKIAFGNFSVLLLLLPLLVFFYSATPPPFLLYGLLGLVILINMFSLNIIYRQNLNLLRDNWFYFILYLCTLEIAPYFILYKLFTI